MTSSTNLGSFAAILDKYFRDGHARNSIVPRSASRLGIGGSENQPFFFNGSIHIGFSSFSKKCRCCSKRTILATALSTMSGVGFVQDFIQRVHWPEELSYHCVQKGLQGSKSVLQVSFGNHLRIDTSMSVLLEPISNLHP